MDKIPPRNGKGRVDGDGGGNSRRSISICFLGERVLNQFLNILDDLRHFRQSDPIIDEIIFHADFPAVRPIIFFVYFQSVAAVRRHKAVLTRLIRFLRIIDFIFAHQNAVFINGNGRLRQ